MHYTSKINLAKSILLIFSILLAACANDDFKIALPEVDPDIDEGELIELPISLGSGSFVVNAGSRDDLTETATAAEKRISDFWLFQYDASGQALINPRYYTVGARITAITDLDKGLDNNGDYVFYSLAGKTTFSQLKDKGAALRYTIKHPTCFLCGTIEAGDTYKSNISGTEGIYQEDGDWNPDHDNKLWGGLEPDDNLKHLVINAATGNTIYDNYGQNKSIFDPCPKGWRVSPPDLWLEFTSTGLNPTSKEQVNYDSYVQGGLYMHLEDWKDGPTSFFPLTGAKRADGMISHTGQCGNYHNATAAKNNVVNCMHMHNSADPGWFAVFEVNCLHYRTKSLAGPIRCVRDRK